jgi:hypothetical protein
MRLLYQHIIQSISKDDSQVIVNDLKGRVATGFKVTKELKKDTIFKFLTTSRSVETWLQNLDSNIKLMNHKKVPFEFWMVTGGYGAGKSHMKEFLRRNKIKNLEFLEPSISSVLQSNQKKVFIDNIFSLLLLQTTPLLVNLYNAMIKRPQFSTNEEALENGIKKTLRRYSIGDDFIDAFCNYAGSDSQVDFSDLEEKIVKNGEQLFLPLMRLYKNHLKINGFCIFIDEFESLQFLDRKTRARFVQSIRPFYDAIASARSDPDLPSLKMIVLCTLSFWNELTKDTRSQALETRIHLFEIPPLVEDEIIALAEKIYLIHKKSGYPAPVIRLKFNKLPAYLVHRAGIEAPLTPRFVISEIINLIEEPNDYLEFNSQAQND